MPAPRLHQIAITIRLTLPLLAAFLAQKGMQLIDTYMMGWIGPTALAAGALGTTIFMTTLMFCRGILTATGIFIVRARGAEQMEEVNSNLQQSVYLALMLAIPSMLLIWEIPRLLLLTGQHPTVVAETQALLNGLVWGVPGFLLFLTYREFIAAFSLTRIIMIVALCSLPLTFAANYVLIYGKLGFPALGITGIGFASALVMWFMFLCLWVYSRLHPHLSRFKATKQLPISWRRIMDLLRVGVPSGVITVLDSMLFLAAAILIGYFGVIPLAAFQIAMQWVSIAFNVPLALSIVISLQVGHAIGSGDPVQARRSAGLGLMVGLIAAVIIVLPFFFTPEILAKVFLQSSEAGRQQIINTATTFLTAAALFQCFDALQVLVNGILRGYKDTLMPMIVSIGCYLIVGIGGGCYLSFHTQAGVMGVWYGMMLAICSAALLLLWRFLRRLKSSGNKLVISSKI